ncbi:MAG: alkaline phytoceramidase, partial [Proteobacteria bacterium]|nr:alkaline phytoceramidase [Pseudomonadota bacterium]
VPYVYFFIGVALVGPGSAWYHLDPNNSTLFWDRLPMTIAFMALVAAVLSDRISRGWVACRGLNLLVAAGIVSVVWWDYGEIRGAGDLRAYALVQFWPVVLIPLVLYLFPGGRHVRMRYLVAALVFYALAKLLEHYDHGVFALTGGAVSGHSIKHLLATLAPAAILAMMRQWPREGEG